MECIILAGGFGTRLSHVVPNLPKPMAPIAGRPFLEILLERLASKGFQRAILALGYMADTIQIHFGDKFSGLALEYVVENKPLGTGGAIRFATDKMLEDHIFIFNGDTYLNLEVDRVEAVWQARRAPIIIGTVVPDAYRYGRLITTDNRVTGFADKGFEGPGLINAGCYVLNAGQLDSFVTGTAFSMEMDYLALDISRHGFDLFTTEGMFIDIGVPEDYQRAQIELKSKLQ